MKNLILSSVVLMAGCISLSNQCLAQSLDSSSVDSSGFRTIIRDSEKSCPNLRCANSAVQASAPLSKKEIDSLGQPLLTQLHAVAQEIAETEWPETILEGPYAASFNIQISQIQLLNDKAGLLGYWITYEDKAWYIENCNYDPRDLSSLNKCEAGRFVESAFVSAKNGEGYRDPNGYVEFRK